MVDNADPEVIEQAAADWTAGQVRCRSYNNHAWQPLSATRHGQSYLIVQRCSRCRNERENTMNAQGHYLSGWKPRYRPGYLLPKGTGRVDEEGRARLRLLDLTRLRVTVAAEEEEAE
jgi:hypothetical protein